MCWDRQNLFVIAGFVSAYLYCNSARLHILFVIAGFVIAGCHCILGANSLSTFCSSLSFQLRL